MVNLNYGCRFCLFGLRKRLFLLCSSRGISEEVVCIIVKTIFCVDEAGFWSINAVLLDQCLESPTWPRLPSSCPLCRRNSRCKLHSSSWSSSSQAYTHTGSEVAAGRLSTCRCRWGTGSWQHRTGRFRLLYRCKQHSCCWKRTLIWYVLDTPKHTRQWSSAREEKDRRQFSSTFLWENSL